MHVAVAQVSVARHAAAGHPAHAVASSPIASIGAPVTHHRWHPRGVHDPAASCPPAAPSALTVPWCVSLLKPPALGVLPSSWTPHPSASRALGVHGRHGLLKPDAEKTSSAPRGVLLTAIRHAPHASAVAASTPHAITTAPRPATETEVPPLTVPSSLPRQPVGERVALLPLLLTKGLLLQLLLPRLLRVTPPPVLLSQPR